MTIGEVLAETVVFNEKMNSDKTLTAKQRKKAVAAFKSELRNRVRAEAANG